MAEGDGIYVDLRGEFATPDPNAPVLAMLHRMQRELAELRSQNVTPPICVLKFLNVRHLYLILRGWTPRDEYGVNVFAYLFEEINKIIVKFDQKRI